MPNKPATVITRNEVLGLTSNRIISVYSGRKTLSGWNPYQGKHTFSSFHLAEGGGRRGYPVAPAEINDRQVSRVLNLVQKNILAGANPFINRFSQVELPIGRRVYVLCVAATTQE